MSILRTNIVCRCKNLMMWGRMLAEPTVIEAVIASFLSPVYCQYLIELFKGELRLFKAFFKVNWALVPCFRVYSF